VNLDLILLQQVEIHCGGEEIHTALNLMAGYISAVQEYCGGNEKFLSIAQEVERQLRAFLVTLRLKRCFLD